MPMSDWPNAVLIGAAAAPAAALLALIYRADRGERESPALLAGLMLLGVAAAILARGLELAGIWALDALWPEGGALREAMLCFAVVALSEEGAKYALLRRATWNAPAFDSRFDGVVYAVAVSMGFALWENLGYVLMNGLGTALLRAMTAVPGHACFGVFMGCWYGQARYYSGLGRIPAARWLGAAALILPALLHGAYDYLAGAAGSRAPWPFAAFVSVLFAAALAGARRSSRSDGAIGGVEK